MSRACREDRRCSWSMGFVVEQGLQARAATVLRGQRPSVQEAVIARGALLGTGPMDLELFCRVQEDS